MSNRQIASHLDLAEVTIKRHLANLYPKMGVSSRGGALRAALQNEWLNLWLSMREIEATTDEQ